VRLPGDQASRNIAVALEQGIGLPAATVAQLDRWAARLGVESVPAE
jgi:hypothetical protein